MVNIVEEQKKRIRYMYTHMFRRYRANTLADGGSISDKPVLGAELIPDASRWFNIDNDPYWTKSSGVTISGGVCNFNIATNGGLTRTDSNVLTIGKLYAVTYTITRTSGSIRFVFTGNAGVFRTTSGTYTDYLTCTNTFFGFLGQFGLGFVGTIDNISVREVLTQSVTTDYLKMAQNNRMDKSIRFGWVGEAGSKIESGRVSKLYDINCFEQLGSELVTNGDFSNGSTNWVIQSGWKIFNGYIISNGMGNINCNANFVSGRRYKISYNLSNNTGGVRVGSNLVYFDTANTTSGLYSVIVNYAGGDGRLYFSQMNNNGISTINNVSVKEVLNATNTNNATQTTPTSHPYLTGNIAPNEKLGLKNPNGGSNFMTHPTISFAANESWSVTTVFRFNGTSILYPSIFNGINASLFFINGALILKMESGDTTFPLFNLNKYIGKTLTLTLVYNTIDISLYANGIYISKITRNNTLLLSNFFGFASYNYFNASAYSHIIRSQALTPTQVTAEYNYLRSVYPEIESVQIGTQTWATSNCEMAATPQGNVIAEMQAAGNVEKITNIADREFSSDTGFWSKSAQSTISGGICNIKSNDGTFQNIMCPAVSVGKYCKATISIVRVGSGQLKFQFTGDTSSTGNQLIPAAVGTYSLFWINNGTGNIISIGRVTGITDIDIDNVSIQEIGWSGSQELYDGIYAQTAGTVEQKTYAAVKAAAMWSHYDNSVGNGATYGKLYNWFAVKLLQMDIDYYNAANPTALWGWRVPTQADFQTLSTYLGGDAVAGGKLKLAGTTYWNSPNTGADNSSGFSLIGGGFRNPTFLDFGVTGNIQCLTEISTLQNKVFRNRNIYVDLESLDRDKTFGYPLRLIKTT